MEQITTHDHSNSLRSRKSWKIASIMVGFLALVLALYLVAVLRRNPSSELLVLIGLLLCSVAVLHARFLHLARSAYQQTSCQIRSKDRELRSIFESTPDGVLVLDDSGTCRAANTAALRLFGIPRSQLLGSFVARFCHSGEFDRCWERLISGQSNREQLELFREDDTTCFVDLTSGASFPPGCRMVFLRDATERRRAEDAVGQSLALARSAWKEADALRKATVVLTQDLDLDIVLDTLFAALSGLVPYDEAQVLLLETDSRLFLAREVFSHERNEGRPEWPKTLDLFKYPILQLVLQTQEGVLIPDTRNEENWHPMRAGLSVRSWLGIRLFATGEVLGLLSLGHFTPQGFSKEHVRLAQSVAISAAAAIKNVRLHERAAIYGAELETRLEDLRRAERVLKRAKENRRSSE